MAAIVVQFGFATMPSGRSATAWSFTPATTSGTRSSMRQAEELSTTTAPAAATLAAISRLVVAPAEKSATSRPR